MGRLTFMSLANTFLVFVAAVLACGCSKTDTVRIPDVTQTNTVSLVTRRFPGVLKETPDGIRVHVYGEIDGTAYIYNPLWGTNALAGRVEWSRTSDWFHTNCEFLYMPDRVRSGHLTFHCEFW